MNTSLKGTILWTCVIGVMGATLFFVKHEVKDLENRLGAVNHDIQRNQEDIHVLKAEWSFLNDPVRLRQLAERHLGMKQMGPTQIATLNSLNYGPSAPPTALVQAAPKVAPATAPTAVVEAVPTSAPAPHHRIAGGTGLAMATPFAGETR